MYAPGDFTFTAAGGQAVVRQTDGTYKTPSGYTFTIFHDWYRGTSGPYDIVCKSAEVGCPRMDILGSLTKAKAHTAPRARFMFAEEAFAIVREVPELLVLWPVEIREPVRELAMGFLLYDDIAAHPVWLACAQEAMQLVRKIDKEYGSRVESAQKQDI